MASYSLDPISANCYPDTTVLINKFGIRDETKLLEAEIAITQEAAAFWELARNAGYRLYFADIDVDELMISTIQFAGGVEDGLRRIFYEAIK